MIDGQTRTRPGVRTAFLIAEAARVLAVVAAGVCAVTGNWDDVVRFVIVFATLLVPRLASVRPLFDATFGVTLILATVAMAAGWYASDPWVDLPIHAATTGATAVVVVLLLRRIGLLTTVAAHTWRRRSAADVLQVVVTGFTVGVLWEVYEWIATEAFHIRMVVGYTDTVVDLLMDGLGAAAAGAALAWSNRHHHRQQLEGSLTPLVSRSGSAHDSGGVDGYRYREGNDVLL